MASSAYSIFYRFRIFDPEGNFIGKGRIQLLELIHQYGSINRAAADMEMSYRQAWQMVKEMNSFSGKPLVEKQHGGKSGGGTVLTKQGMQVIEAYHKFNDALQEFTDALAGQITF